MAAEKGNRYSASENRTLIVRDTLRRIAKQNPKQLRSACQKIFDKAMDGDLDSFRTIADRLDGKPAQIIQGNSPDGSIVIIQRVITTKE